MYKNQSNKKQEQLVARVNTLLQQAHTHHQQGKLNEALLGYQQILQLAPNHFDALHLTAVANMQLGQLDQALVFFDKAIVLNPNYAPVYSNRGNALQALGRFEEAQNYYNKAISIDPHYADAYLNIGNNMRSIGEPEKALANYDFAISLKPNHAGLFCNRGNALYDLRRFEEAIVAYDQALAINPNYAQALSNRGVSLYNLNHFDEALAYYNKAITVDPNYIEAYSNRGNALQAQQRYQEAYDSYMQALAINPAYLDADYNAGVCLLTLGDFTNGWAKYESRWKVKNFVNQKPQYPKPEWTGQAIDGKTLLIYTEQGLGDGMQFCRYAKLVHQLGATVLLVVPDALKALLNPLAGIAAIFNRDENLPDFDYYCTSISVPHILKTDLSNIPNEVPYLFADPARVNAWKAQLGEKKKLRIGLAWSGNIAFRDDRNRSIRLEQLNALRFDQVEFFCLQKELREHDVNALTARPDIQTFTEQFDNFTDTAALIELMDLVITIDTSVAHLAAAMGKPVWIMLRYAPDWRWLLEREDSPWYPTIRLFRQPNLGDWDNVIARVKDALTQKLLST